MTTYHSVAKQRITSKHKHNKQEQVRKERPALLIKHKGKPKQYFPHKHIPITNPPVLGFSIT